LGDYTAASPDTNLNLGAMVWAVVPNYPDLSNWYHPNAIAQVLDGTSNTMLLGEKHVRPTEFGLSPDTSIYNADSGQTPIRVAGQFPLARGPTEDVGGNRHWQFGSYHPTVVQFVFCDSSVRQVNVNTSTLSLSRLADRRDGQVIPDSP
jgi:hypothetical protein